MIFEFWSIIVHPYLKLNVDEQQDAIKHLKEHCDIDYIESPCKDKHVINHLHDKMFGKTYYGKIH